MQTTVTKEKIDDTSSIAEEWKEIQSNSECKYFLTWGWIGPWLEQVSKIADVNILKITQGDLIIGLCTYLSIKKRKHYYRSTEIYFNELPVHPYNMVIEYNGPLLRKGYEKAATLAMMEWFVSAYENWDEINLNAIDATSGFYKYLKNKVLSGL